MMLDARPMDDQLSRLTEAHALLMRANANLQALPSHGVDHTELDDLLNALDECLTRVDALAMDIAEQAEK